MNREFKFRSFTCKGMEYEIEKAGQMAFYIKSFKLMQFVGFKDKNGVDIYEGDILKVNHPDIVGYFIGVVFYQEEMASFFFQPKGDLEDTCLHIYDEFEVIGNIYQHQELLN